MKRMLRKVMVLVLVLALLGTSATVLAAQDASIEIDLKNIGAQSFEVQWQGQPATITIGEAVPAGPQPRYDYNLTEGVGTWTREIYIDVTVFWVTYIVNYTMDSNYRVRINDVYAPRQGGVGVIPTFVESKIVRAQETGSYSAACYSIWSLAAGQWVSTSISLMAEFKDRVLSVYI